MGFEDVPDDVLEEGAKVIVAVADWVHSERETFLSDPRAVSLPSPSGIPLRDMTIGELEMRAEILADRTGEQLRLQRERSRRASALVSGILEFLVNAGISASLSRVHSGS